MVTFATSTTASKQRPNSNIGFCLIIRLLGVLLFGLATLNLININNDSSLMVFDPLLGVHTSSAKLLLGCLLLLVSMICLFTKKLSLATGLLAWTMTNFAMYKIGILLNGCHVGSGCIGNALCPPNLISRLSDQMSWIMLGAWLLVCYGVGLRLWLAKSPVPLNSTLETEFHKICCPFCGVRIQFDLKNLFQRIACPHCQKPITLRKASLIKVACSICSERIEVQTDALGQWIACPHCLNKIMLKEPA